MALTKTNILSGIFNPQSTISYLLRMLPIGFAFLLRVELNGVERPHYAYGLLHAAREAKKLGIKKISAIEFGVGSGGGIIALEKIAKQITKLTNVQIDIYGFDLGKGLPKPKDYRDLAFMWKEGFFKMDRKKLEQKIKKTTTLIFGDVKKTVPQFIKKSFAPIGFIAFDLDYYSSTVDALKIFDVKNSLLLPRTFCYFDDLIGDDNEIYSQYTGELLAINEFNKKHSSKKLDVINGLVHKRIIKNTYWYENIYVLHVFNHALYNSYLHHNENRQG